MTDQHELLRMAMKEAGGQAAVARSVDRAPSAVFKWLHKGLPRTEWTGESDYARHICRLANANVNRSRDWQVADLLARRGEASRPALVG